jgi:hypothetical protein
VTNHAVQCDDQCEVVDISATYKTQEGPQTTIRLWDAKRGIGLEARVYQFHPDRKSGEQYEQLELFVSDSAADNGPPEAQQKTNLKAYNAAVPLLDLVKDGSNSKARSFTFLAAIRFFETPISLNGESQEPPCSAKWPSCPTSKEIYEYVGVNPLSPGATGAMWDTVFIERLKNSESILDLDELNLVGRSLEKILQVDIVAVSFGNDTKDTQGLVTTKSQDDDLASSNSLVGAALVSNLFVSPNIDLKALL